jgi:hypothetical protein
LGHPLGGCHSKEAGGLGAQQAKMGTAELLSGHGEGHTHHGGAALGGPHEGPLIQVLTPSPIAEAPRVQLAGMGQAAKYSSAPALPSPVLAIEDPSDFA